MVGSVSRVGVGCRDEARQRGKHARTGTKRREASTAESLPDDGLVTHRTVT